MPPRQNVIRTATARFAAGERLRLLNHINFALAGEGLREMNAREGEHVLRSWADGRLPYGQERIPSPADMKEDEA